MNNLELKQLISDSGLVASIEFSVPEVGKQQLLFTEIA
jgi:hypothetical protein